MQEGRGKYKEQSKTTIEASSDVSGDVSGRQKNATMVYVDVDACTFDRVLLYLEHEAHGEEFR